MRWNADLKQTKFLFVAMQTVGLGIDGDSIVWFKCRDQVGQLARGSNHTKIPKPKTQAPGKPQLPSSKEGREAFEYWILRFPWDLELGIWSLLI